MIPIAKPFLGREEKDAVISVLESGMLAAGSFVTDFENDFSSYIEMPCAVACGSGTAALELALRTHGIQKGDKILTTAYSFIASANCIVYTGATPCFCDIDTASFLMTPAHIRAALEKHSDVKAILAVHLFGQPCDMEAILAIARERGLLVIEDCAQSHGAVWDGRRAGSYGDASCFSFYPTKNMTTAEGGMVLLRDEDTARRCRMLANHGMRERYRHEIIGYNYRMTNIAAAIGAAQLKKLPGFNAARQKNAVYLSAHISNPLITTPAVTRGCEHVFHQYTVKVKDRDRFVRHLEARGIGYGIFYPLTIPEQQCYGGMGFEEDFPGADEVKQQVVSLPVHPSLTDDDLGEIVRAVNEFQ